MHWCCAAAAVCSLAFGVEAVHASGLKTNSLYLETDQFNRTNAPLTEIRPLAIEDGSPDSRLHYVFVSSERWNPREALPSPANCAVLLGITGGLSLVFAVRNRLRSP